MGMEGAMGLKNIGEVLLGLRGSSQRRKSHTQKAANSCDFFDFLKLIKNWPRIVGPQLAQHTLPLKINGGKLFIMTAHSLYAQQLQNFERDIIKKIVDLWPNSKTQIKEIAFQATEYFDSIKAQQNQGLQAKRELTQNDPNKHHQFDPNYIKIRERVRTELPQMEDQEVQALLEEMNIAYYSQQEDA